MLEYLSVVLVTVFLPLYLGQYASSKILRAFQYTAVIGACLLFTDSIFYTSVLQYYQALLVLCIVPGIAGLFWTMRRPTGEQAAALYGIAVFFLAAVGDIIMYSDIFGDTPTNAPISEAAMLVFMLAQAVSLFAMNNRLIAEARASERQLVAEKETLESLNRLKTEFLGNVSHELKTPLTVVSGYAQISRTLLPGAENEAVRDNMRIIAAEADRLALMVGQVLDLTRIEEGRIVLEKRPCHIDELIYQAVNTHFPILNKNGNRLNIRVSPELPELSVDPGRITQVLVNLISNAVRHTTQSVISVSAQQAGAHVAVTVADTGTGISPQALPLLFTRFHRRSPGSSETGTGLGLYICKYLVEQHSGTITVDSTVGVGTKVTFSLPINA